MDLLFTDPAYSWLIKWALYFAYSPFFWVFVGSFFLVFVVGVFTFVSWFRVFFHVFSVFCRCVHGFHGIFDSSLMNHEPLGTNPPFSHLNNVLTFVDSTLAAFPRNVSLANSGVQQYTLYLNTAWAVMFFELTSYFFLPSKCYSSPATRHIPLKTFQSPAIFLSWGVICLYSAANNTTLQSRSYL